MPYASVNGFRMFYDARGEGEVVVFIHGGFPSLDMHLRALSSGMWGWEIDFTSDFRFVMYDRRGCWLSSPPEAGYDIENQARDLSELLGHLEVEKAHVIGSSGAEFRVYSDESHSPVHRSVGVREDLMAFSGKRG